MDSLFGLEEEAEKDPIQESKRDPERGPFSDPIEERPSLTSAGVT